MILCGRRERWRIDRQLKIRYICWWCGGNIEDENTMCEDDDVDNGDSKFSLDKHLHLKVQVPVCHHYFPVNFHFHFSLNSILSLTPLLSLLFSFYHECITYIRIRTYLLLNSSSWAPWSEIIFFSNDHHLFSIHFKSSQ